MVTVPASTLDRYGRCTLYNSPYPAHDRGNAVDLYPPAAVATPPGSGTRAPSPVAGRVIDARTVAAPDRPYAAAHDHLLLVDVERPASARRMVGRILHVAPAVAAGDRVGVGDDLGALVRSGYAAPWVDDHLHVEFRPRDADRYRATGSVRVELGVDPEPLAWDGTGRVVEVGDTYAVLDAPAHPAPGERWVGVAAGVDGATGALDGGLPHYDGGGLLGVDRDGPVALFDGRVGTAASRDVTWDDVTVLADGEPVTGLSLFFARDEFGAKLICPGRAFAVGQAVTVDVRARTGA